MDLFYIPSVQVGLSSLKLIISVESVPPPAMIPKVLVPRRRVEQPWEFLLMFMEGPGLTVVVGKSTNQVDPDLNRS